MQDELDQARIGESLLAASDEVLASIPQITMEMHVYDDPKIV